jgi:NADH:ubiquinone reductase (H+-translocating)
MAQPFALENLRFDVLHIFDSTVLFWPMHGKIIILGGGFGGRQAARSLARADAEVVVVDPSPVTVMLPGLPDLAGGWIDPRFLQRRLADLLPPNATHLQARADSIDLHASSVVAGGQTLSYDQLVIASGSVATPLEPSFPPDKVYPLATLADALRIREDFPAYLRDAPSPHLLVVGGGYTGLELAASLLFRARQSRRSCRATVLDRAPQSLPFLPDAQRRRVLDFLGELGVDVRSGVAVDRFDGRSAVVGGQLIDDVFFCWAAGSAFAVPNMKGDVERIRDGRLRVAPDLSLPHHPNAFAVGDSAAIEPHGRPLRKAVNFAYYGGRHAGRNVARRLRGRPTRPFRPVDLGWIVPLHECSVGRLPGGIWIRGGLGIRLHHLMCGVRNYSLSNFAGCLRLALNPYPKGTHP